MACNVTITLVRGYTDPGSTIPHTIHVEGTVEDCTSKTIYVLTSCEKNIRKFELNASSGMWEADYIVGLNHNCSCGENIRVDASCPTGPGEICNNDIWSGPFQCETRALCPRIDNILVTPLECNDDGTRTVHLEAKVSGAQANYFHWEFGDGESISLNANNFPNAETEHDYPAPGTQEQEYLVSLTVTGTNPACIDTRNESFEVRGCEGDCPEIRDLIIESGPCTESGIRRTVILNAIIDGGRAEEYEWDFGDGETEIIDAIVTSDPRTTHDYFAPGTYTVTLTIKGPGECGEKSESRNLSVERCPNGNGTGACCLPDGSCVDGISRQQCEEQGGTYIGNETTCGDVDCNGSPPSQSNSCGFWCSLAGFLLVAVPISAHVSTAAHCASGEFLALQAAAIVVTISWYLVKCGPCCLWRFLFLGGLLGIIATIVAAYWLGFPQCWPNGLALLIGYALSGLAYLELCDPGINVRAIRRILEFIRDLFS